MPTISEQLKEHLQNGRDWEKMSTPVSGVYVVKVPKTKTRPAMLQLEINPLKDDGKPMKKKGLFISSKEMLIKFAELISEDQSYQILNATENINKGDRYKPKEYKTVAEEKKEEIIEIVEEEMDELEEMGEEVEIKKPEQETIDIQEEKTVLVVIDGPNSLGENFQDQLDLEEVAKYAHSLDKNAELYYLTKTSQNHIAQDQISRIGYDIRVSHKDIDYAVKILIRKRLNSTVSPNLILIGTKDQDYMEFIKEIRKEYNIKVKLLISSEKGLAKSLKRSFNEEDIKKFPKKMEKALVEKESVYRFLTDKKGNIATWTLTGKVCYPDREGKFQPKRGEKWLCKINKEYDKSIILTLIKRIF